MASSLPRLSVRRPLLALACVLALAGCSDVSGTGDKGYVSGNGEITQVAVADRGDPIELAGEGLDGESLSLDDLRGKVVVVNVWGAWCPPCRTEQPDLVEVAEQSGDDVAFLGINIRDASPEQARAFVRRYEVPYPSVYSPDAEALLAFAGTLTPRSIPSTVVLDTEGRVAASILGVTTAGTLGALVDEVAAEDG